MIYIVGQTITCLLIIAGYFFNRYLVSMAAEKVLADEKALAAITLFEREKLEARLAFMEERIQKLEAEKELTLLTE